MIECQICHKKFKYIINTHLKKHKINFNEYLNMFPNVSLISEETRKKMSGLNNGMFGIHRLGKMSPFYGYKHSIKSKQKISNIHKGRKLSEEHKRKISESKKGKIVSEETRKKMSKSRMGCGSYWYGKFGKNHFRFGKNAAKGAGYGKGSYYESPLQGKIWLRSSYELAYAKYLDDNKILWYYEIETFELSNEMTYTPDFFLPRYEKFIEVKGYMLPKAKIKINKFKEEYPFDLEILFKDDLIKLGIKII